MGEFDVIARYFHRTKDLKRAEPANQQVALGIGDDCALLSPRAGMQLAVSSDMLVQGRHFFKDVFPQALGHKALAVNLSDLAACGAQPVAFTLALALPQIDEAWLSGFASGMFALADAHGCQLMGGDTTRGPLNICITVIGQVPSGQALLRSGARAGDDVYVSGTLGDAALALQALQGKVQISPALLAVARQRLERPSPRVALGLALRGVATAAIDVSDGLLGDLAHVLRASGCGAEIDIEIIANCSIFASENHGFDALYCQQLTAAGGDDYELVFTAPVAARAQVAQAALNSATKVTRIGSITATRGLVLRDASGAEVAQSFASFDHFKV